MERTTCVFYLRVSTDMQVDNYSLDAQLNELKGWCNYKHWDCVKQYVDAGYSGKSASGRPAFVQMLEDIKCGVIKPTYVVVARLSRFGRNAGDALKSLELLQSCGVELYALKEGIDTSTSIGKLLLTILSAVAEQERFNIISNTTAGRQQKAREGRWNGAQAPYGYSIGDGGVLQIDEKEAEHIRIIYDKFVNTNLGLRGISRYMFENGYKKILRGNAKRPDFSTDFIKDVLDSEVYKGYITYGKRKQEPIKGKPNETKYVYSDDYICVKGLHEGIISEELWELAHEKRKESAHKFNRVHSLEHEHILGGLLRCPVCDSHMLGGVNRKKKKGKDEYYKDQFYYACYYHRTFRGKECPYSKQWHQDVLNGVVLKIIKGIINSDKVASALEAAVKQSSDLGTLTAELNNLKVELSKLEKNKERLSFDIDNLDSSSPLYEQMYKDYNNRLLCFYESINELNGRIYDKEEVINGIEKDNLNYQNIRTILENFDKLWDCCTDLERKELMQSLISRIDIYEDVQPDGAIVKSITFKFPVVDGCNTFSYTEEGTVESLVLLCRERSSCLEVTLNLEGTDLIPKAKNTPYSALKSFIYNKYGVKVSSLQIAQIKRELGIIERENYNKPSGKYKQPNCPQSKRDIIIETFKYFEII